MPASFEFQLLPADALSYQRLPRELTGREQLLLFAVPFLAGGVAGAVPETWPALWRWAAAGFAGLFLAGLLLALRDVARRRRARRMAAEQGNVRVEDLGDHLVVRSQGGSRFLALETIAQVIADREHIFLRHEGGPTILPLRAFSDVADMRAYAEVLDKRSREAGG